MKLKSCYIEGFGNIKQRGFDFSSELTSYCEHNGYGKTTLAGFLKAMFYGLKQTTARDKELGERARFYPFEGGKFGGNVTIEKGGELYKIERFFGKKSATEDTIAVYRNGQRVSMSEDLGKEFFGLDEQSFLRTVFLTSADTESGATGDISRMLNGFVDDADFDGARKLLEKQLKEYKLARGRGGAIDAKHDEVLRLQENIENKEKINIELSRKYAERKALAVAVADLEAKQTSARDKNLVLQKWQTYDGFVADAAAERAKLDSLKNKYPAGLPEEDEIRDLKKHIEELNLANERHISATFSAEKGVRLEELAVRFAHGTPTDEDVASANGRAAEIIRLDTEIDSLENSLKVTDNKFASGVPEDEEVKKYGEKIVALREKKTEEPHRGGSPVSKKVALGLAVLAVAALGAGVALMVLGMMLYGGILLGVGGVAALAGIFTYFKGQISGMQAAAPSAGNAELENDIRLFLAKYGYYSDGGVEVDYNNLVRDLESYNSSREERERNERLLAEKKAAAEVVKGEVSAFLEGYGFGGGNVQADLTRLGALVAEYAALNAEKADVTARAAATGEDIENHRNAVQTILDKYEIAARENLGGLADGLERDRTEFVRLGENCARLDKKAADFKEQNGLDERAADDLEDVQSIDSELSKKRDELSLLDREISDDETSVERLSELKEELERAKEDEGALRKGHELLIKTISFLDMAEQSLKDRYVSPVKNSFLNYSRLLERVLGEKVTFDKDFKVKFERGGEDRSDAHLSAGQKSLCTLCLRLALIDNMYRDEKPFIIMDDPFVHLDGEHMKRAGLLLRELARGKQIIYFCCHESRKI